MCTSLASVCSYCVQAHAWLRSLCLLLSLYLLYDELCLYFVKRPTLVSETKSRTENQLFPVITVCLLDGVDSAILAKLGYTATASPSHDYFFGNFMPFRNISDFSFVGWSGDGQHSKPLELMERAMLVQNTSLVSKARFSFKSSTEGSAAASFYKASKLITSNIFSMPLCFS